MNHTAPAQQPFWQQDAVRRALTEAKNRQRLARSYLFTGPVGVGKWAVSQWLAKSLLCEQAGPAERPCDSCTVCRRTDHGAHLDWHVLLPLPKATMDEDRAAFLRAKEKDPFAVVTFAKKPNLAVDWVRDLIGELSKTAAEGGAKVSIIISADQMTHDAQTILLKSIEEPPPNTHFILTSSDPGRILPTVRSRCQVIRFAPVDPDAIATRLVAEGLTDSDDAEIVARLCGGGWGNAKRLVDEKLKTWRQTVSAFWDNAFALNPGDMIGEIEKTFRSRGFDDVMQAFDIWGLLLRRDSARVDPSQSPSGPRAGIPLPDMETAWACWRILQNGRSTLHVNVIQRSAVKGTFLTLRRRLGRL
jgi:DNA polymerase-3 subunit delta'